MEEESEKIKKKVQIIAQAYYARKDVQQAIYDFCKHRETIPRYLEGFGKRPDVLDYPNDLFNYAKKGATSFHCSEEIWEDPLKISTDMTPEQYSQIRTGWDLLIDIDSKYFDYSKIAAKLLLKALEYHQVKNTKLKFSGSKGIHMLIPWKAFPKEVSGIETKTMFPEWPRLIAEYLQEMVHDQLTNEILKMSNQDDLEKQGKQISEIRCKQCNNLAEEQKITKYLCPNFKCRSEVNSTTKSKRKTLRCPGCNGDLEKVSEEIFYICHNCNLTSQKNPEMFEKKATAKALIDSVDLVLVASRHLFRAPYSLHEKTSLASVVINKEDIDSFQPSDADPLKVQIKDYNPDCEEGEARELLLQALDWAKKKNKEPKKFTGKTIDLKGLTITEDMFPDCIKKLLLGVKDDGRKRALSLLLAFFSSLEFPKEYIEDKIFQWNKKNYKQLKEGYIKSQIDWFVKNPRMPQNYDKPIYKELLILGDTKGLKNPINYTIKEAFKRKGVSKKKKNEIT